MASVFGAIYPGIQQIKSLRYTVKHGVQPGLIQIEFLPQTANPAPYGDLVLFFDNFSFTVRGCAADYSMLKINDQGWIQGIVLMDGRWRWKFSGVDYLANLSSDDGTFVSATSKPPQQIFAELFALMGHGNVFLPDLPSNDRPSVDLHGQRADIEIARLARLYGCVPAYNPVTDIVGLARVGVGNGLPSGEEQSIVYVVDQKPFPGTVELRTAPIAYQARFLLSAVGLDSDGSVKPIDQLSYKPSGGWESEPGPFFRFDSISDESNRKLAQRSVFKWYRISTFSDGSLTPPNATRELDHVNQALPLLPYLVRSYEATDGSYQSNTAAVFGRFYRESESQAYNLTTAGTPYTEPFSVDRRNGIAKFQNPVYQVNSSGQTKPADIHLEAAFQVTNPDDLQKQRFFHFRTVFPEAGAGKEVIHRNDIKPFAFHNYTTGSDTQTGTTHNQSDVEQSLAEYMQFIALKYQTGFATSKIYRGLVPVNITGRVREVTWKFDDQEGAKTIASDNTEQEPGLPRSVALERSAQQISTQEASDRFSVYAQWVKEGRV